MKKSPLFAILVALSLTAAGHAAVLTGSLNATPPASVNLTTAGTVDWAIWNLSSSLSTPRLPTNYKSGGPRAVSAISAVGGGSIRGYTQVPTELYSYTDGANSPTTLTNSTQNFAANSDLDTLGRGVSLTITGDPAQLYKVDVWTSGFNATGTLTANLTGATSYSDFNSYGASKTPALYSFTFQPNSASDLLTIQYVMTADLGSSAHVGIQAVTISAIPEPSTLVLLVGALGALASVQRRRRA
jgi:hypothetical protein